MAEDRTGVPSEKMKLLSKAISHYLNGEYEKIMDDEDPARLIENDLCTHDLRDHDVSDTNENDLTDEGITKKCDVEDWLECEDINPAGADCLIESKNLNGFDPFSQLHADDYQSQRSSYKNMRNNKGKSRHDRDNMKEAEKEISNESIMMIIQSSQRSEERANPANQKYVSLAGTKEPEVVDK